MPKPYLTPFDEMKAIEVKNLTVRLGNQLVLEKVNFDAEPEKIIAVIGPNGSGKTTLIRAILGLVPFSGEIKIFGEPNRKNIRRVGYVPQHFNFDRTFPITVEEFLLFSVIGENGSARLEEALREVGMLDYRRRLIGALSGGQLQRILIAKSLLNHPSILLLDEPTSGVDVGGIRDFYSLVSYMRDAYKMTVFIVSHEIGVVRDLADEILCLNRNLICRGKPEEVLTEKHITELYRKGFNLKEHKHQ
jgi:zinc transport system ATP-binding protein